MPDVSDQPTQTNSQGQDAIEAAVWAWFYAHIPGSPVSQSADAWNHLRGALPALIRSLQSQGT